MLTSEFDPTIATAITSNLQCWANQEPITNTTNSNDLLSLSIDQTITEFYNRCCTVMSIVAVDVKR